MSDVRELDSEQKSESAQHINVGIERPPYKLHKIQGIAWSALIGWTIPPGVLMALNYRRVGRTRSAIAMLIATAVVTMMLVSICDQLQPYVNIPKVLLYIPSLWLVYFAAHATEGRLLREHRRRGGETASAWRSVGVTILCVPFILVLSLAYDSITEQNRGTRVVFRGGNIYLQGDATTEDAYLVAASLESAGFFQSSSIYVQLMRVDDVYTLSIPVVKGAWEDPRVTDFIKSVGEAIVVDCGWPELVVRVCDGDFKPYKVIKVRGPDESL